jgi:hypothetical protein
MGAGSGAVTDGEADDGSSKRDRHARDVMQRGLLGGLWSISDFNRSRPRGACILPEPGFITAHPQFADKNFRDLAAFRSKPTWRIPL